MRCMSAPTAMDIFELTKQCFVETDGINHFNSKCCKGVTKDTTAIVMLVFNFKLSEFHAYMFWGVQFTPYSAQLFPDWIVRFWTAVKTE